MRSRITSCILFYLLGSSLLMAQISPGDLTKAHSKYEGMGNCTLCHELGAKVSSMKCLDCHSEIQSLLNQNKGFHSSSGVKGQDCFRCHSEHHGRNFEMIRFDTKSFDHKLTGYTLRGAHQQVDCRKCHAPSNITDNKLRGRQGTFLGLDQQCLSCHEDFHQGTLATNCLQCHTMDGFTPVVNFNHDETNFKLRGSHTTVDCKACHLTTEKNGKPFQQFTGMNFADCKACHSDPHNNQLPGTCNQCHTETSFSTFIGKRNFNHNRTGFELRGSHRSIDCFACHRSNTGLAGLFQDQVSGDENNCVQCHVDPHENKFGQDCSKCHAEESFFLLKDMEFFDHNVTDYPLEGKHTTVDCKACHIERFSAPLDFSACMNCHTDYHNGEFAENGVSPDCAQCHNLEKGFSFTLFTIEDHQKTDFKLEGAHLATPCFACHVDERDQRWSFANKGERCTDCHENFHEDYLAAEFIPNNDCTSCHGSESWDMVTFNHDRTDWPLTGAHRAISCRECHFEISENKVIISQNFSNLSSDCASCHDNVHGEAFNVAGVTECSRCHVTNSWFPEKFDHNDTRFPLTGQHRNVDCKACHEINTRNNTKSIVYKLNKLDC
ncbi:MAG: cytochrome c family protein, partial [Bacteroidia bacterium]|nr:cytochrome c family protein [Bacteroidia bacterium]